MEINDDSWVVIDPNSGEVKNTFNEGDKIIHCKSDDGIDHNFLKGESFVKVIDKIVPKLKEELTQAEFICAFSLIPYISYMDNILRNNGVRMTINDVAKALNQQYETTRKLLKSLENKGVIAVAQVGSIEKPDIKIKSIIANPYIFVRGKCQKREICGIFSDSGWNTVE